MLCTTILLFWIHFCLDLISFVLTDLLFGCQVSGAAPPKPSTSFAHFGFDEQLMHQIRKSEYTQPTPIQCQVSP